MSFDTNVLIVGAGPVGLALALELGLRDVPCLLVEKRDGRTNLPKMSVVSTRNMEFCRRWGIAEEVRGAVWDRERQLDFVYADTLSGKELARLPVPSYSARDKNYHSCEPSAHCPQIFFDPIFARRVRRQASVVFAYNTTVESVAQDDDGVVARVRDANGVRDLRAKYLVGCDGAAGLVRDAIGIRLGGLGAIADSVNIFFRSRDLITLHDKGWARIYRLVDEKGCWSELIPIDAKELWRLTVFNEPQTERDAPAALRRMFGGAFPYELIDVSRWERRDFVAESYRKGRVFIAGDAAHQNSPTGGLGMATGIEEAVNLAWKLDAAIRGWAGPKLLDSYEIERRPIAVRNVELSTRAYKSVETIPAATPGVDYGPALESWRRDLGRFTVPDHWKMQYTYEHSPICVADGTPPDDPLPKAFKPSTRPGSRAPHVWLDDKKNILDLFDERFTLLRLGENPPSAERLVSLVRNRQIPVHVADVPHALAAQIYEKPLVLVRPDGHVAWRGDAVPDDPTAIVDAISGA